VHESTVNWLDEGPCGRLIYQVVQHLLEETVVRVPLRLAETGWSAYSLSALSRSHSHIVQIRIPACLCQTGYFLFPQLQMLPFFAMLECLETRMDDMTFR
jgi:hypothetical protein